MSYRPISKLARQLLVILGVGVGLLSVGISIYAIHVRASVTALISSARNIHSTADAEREITAWRNRSGREFWEESDHLGGDHNYDAQLDNLPISRFYVVEPTAVTVGVTLRGGELRSITVVVTTGRKPSTTASVWVQEWFEPDKPSHFHLVDKGRPWKAVVEFSASVPESKREKAFAFNTRCFVWPGGCKSAQDILPSVWELGTSPQQ